MATESKTPESADSSELANLKFKEKGLIQKLKDLEGKKSEPGFDLTAAKARAEANLAEVRKAIKDAK